MTADFHIDHTETKKEENRHTSSCLVQPHIANKNSNQFKIFTDGSVLENQQAGAEFFSFLYQTYKPTNLGRQFL